MSCFSRGNAVKSLVLLSLGVFDKEISDIWKIQYVFTPVVILLAAILHMD